MEDLIKPSRMIVRKMKGRKQSVKKVSPKPAYNRSKEKKDAHAYS